MDHNFANMRVLMQVYCNSCFKFFLTDLPSRCWTKVFMTTFSRMETSLIFISAIAGESNNNSDNSSVSNTHDRFLLDFKREFSYPRVYRVWETIWAAGSRDHFLPSNLYFLFRHHLLSTVLSLHRSEPGRDLQRYHH